MKTRTGMNRTLTALIGAGCLGAGLWLLGASDAVTEHLPHWWPTHFRNGVLIDRDHLRSLRDTGWWAPLVIGVGALITLLCLRLALTRTPLRGPLPSVPLAAPRAEVRAGALQDAVRRDALAIAGISRAHCRITTHRRSAHLTLRVWTQPGTTPQEVLPALGSVITTAENTLHPRHLTTRTRVSSRPQPTPRVS